MASYKCFNTGVSLVINYLGIWVLRHHYYKTPIGANKMMMKDRNIVDTVKQILVKYINKSRFCFARNRLQLKKKAIHIQTVEGNGRKMSNQVDYNQVDPVLVQHLLIAHRFPLMLICVLNDNNLNQAGAADLGGRQPGCSGRPLVDGEGWPSWGLLRLGQGRHHLRGAVLQHRPTLGNFD